MHTNGRILIVDDNQPLAENLLEIFEDEGLAGTVCTDPAQALALVESSLPYDVVVTDFRMPRMNGVELVKRIKDLHPTLPVFMLSAYLGDVDADSARQAGVVEVLRKPQDLQRLIDHALELVRARSRAPA